jgi:hypothetical protein
MSELGHRLEKPRALFGEVRVRGHGRQLILPQIEILACECSIIWFFIHRPELETRRSLLRHNKAPKSGSRCVAAFFD